jgi:C-terminal processing protease CtpA/Prc
MNSRKIFVPLIAAVLFASQVAAQTDGTGQQDAQTAESHKVRAREEEMERRMHDAERRMAEAARQMALLAAERLPNLEGSQQRFEFFTDDKPRLGVMIGGEDDGPVKGVPIIGVTPGSAADDAGLRAGDVIVAVNGESMGGENSEAASAKLLDLMAGVETGDTLSLEYTRDGKTGKVEVEPKVVANQVFAFSGNGPGFAVPAAPGAPRAMIAPGVMHGPNEYVFQWHSDGWGDMELVELNEGLGRYFGTDEGLLVVSAPESQALQLEDGDVIQKIDGRAPTSVRHALRILSSYQAGETLELEIMRDKKRRKLEVAVPDGMTSGLIPEAPATVRPARAAAPILPDRPVEKT